MEISNISDPVIENPIKDVHTATLPIAGMAWIDTGEGAFLIDTLLTEASAQKVVDLIKEPIKYIVYTHGHMDHVGGTPVFMKDNPEVIASSFLPARFDKYQALSDHRALINSEQFNLPKIKRPVNFIYPTKTFLGDMTIKLGNKTFELHTCRAETDDAVWVYVPEIKTAFIGDLMIGRNFPNVGNPHKPTRFALDWAKELERIRDLSPEYILCNGAGTFFQGKEVQDALNDNIEAIRTLHDQVIDYINEGMHITEIIHAVSLPEHLEKSHYLKPLYSRKEFFVFNVYRWYHGYYDHNPAHLIPRPEKEVMKEIYDLIGDADKIIQRVTQLYEEGQYQMGLEVVDVLIQADPENIDAYKARRKLLEKISEDDDCVMSKNAYLYAIKDDKKMIRKLKRKKK